LSVIVIVIVISLEHSTVVVGVFKFKFEYSIFILFLEKKFNRIYYEVGFNGSGRQLKHWISLHCAWR